MPPFVPVWNYYVRSQVGWKYEKAGEPTAEKKTATMLEAVRNATTLQRRLSIEKSRHLGFNTDQLTLDQARQIREAIDKRQAELASSESSKAA